MGELSRSLRVRPPTISKTITRLAAQGLVARRSRTDDARIVLVTLTAEGEAKLSRIAELTSLMEEEIAELLMTRMRSACGSSCVASRRALPRARPARISTRTATSAPTRKIDSIRALPNRLSRQIMELLFPAAGCPMRYPDFQS